MRIPIKDEKGIQGMRAAGKVSARVLRDVAKMVQPGVTTLEIDQYAKERMDYYGGKSAFYNYHGFPGQICISVNDVIIHGIGSAFQRLVLGDIVSLDVGVLFEGYIGDNAMTVPAGGCSMDAQELLNVTETALKKGIQQAKKGNRISDISFAVQKWVESHGCSVVKEFVGHGVGKHLHEEPQVPNFVDGSKSPLLVPGMTIAIEPMVNAGDDALKILRDGWTTVTKDGSLSAHFEHTVLITDGEPEILTCPD
ncbi:MAG: type I methionyl aminopeptidase [Verrucomicrobia bacterium]|nr:type I methionyl aminopeptidase [Verrucomicrobiota bacterium]MBR5606176.1 type I methionyl aminopeptidase [Verrucomicrobiota bacterium]MBR5691595.1 type I methionyl aminopeptidase [Verrucomicrobiota bacterium]MBR6463941.1 type I methionyl aminopeptidase [Verrucomicrobiota bacterium]